MTHYKIAPQYIKPEWIGETVVIFASGPSVTNQDIKIVRTAHDVGRCKVIAINAMYQKVDYADLLYFCDFKFYKWHVIDKPDIKFINYPAPKVTICPKGELLTPDITQLKCGEACGLSRETGTLNHGRNSGYQCLNLSFLLGCVRIIMIGYDMKPDEQGHTHCHEPHKINTPPSVYENILNDKCFESIAKELIKERIEVINTSMNSALECFNKTQLQEVLL